MRRFVVGALLLGLAASTALAASHEAHAPNLSVNDRWSYDTDPIMAGGATTTTASSSTVAAVPETATVNGAAYETVRTVTNLQTLTELVAGPAGPIQIRTVTDSTTWTRVTDGAIVRVMTTTTSQSFGNEQTTESDTLYDPPCAFFSYPLSVGKTWTVACQSATTVDGVTTESTVQDSYEVLSEASTQVPAGTFDTFVIKNGTGSSGAHTLQYFAPAACTVILTEIKDGDATTFATRLKDYACANPNAGPMTSGGATPTQATPTPSQPTPASPSPTSSTPAASPAPSPSPEPDDEKKTPAWGVVGVLAVLAGAALAARLRRMP